jgi:carboxypeptidase C (cathepsin A)
MTDWYSGYIDASATKHLHYVFVTSRSDPTNDPVVIWFNGGPGCSSLLALFSEHGPYVIDDGEYYIKTNPEPWNKRANILYIESPAGVGFSTYDDANDIYHNDMSQSKDAFNALLSWYKKFPEYKKNDLYISGESYGGIYVPYLAW